jgi:hypothetical protein
MTVDEPVSQGDAHRSPAPEKMGPDLLRRTGQRKRQRTVFRADRREGLLTRDVPGRVERAARRETPRRGA